MGVVGQPLVEDGMNLPGHLGIALGQAKPAQNFTQSPAEAVIAFGIDPVGLVGQVVALAEEFIGPSGALLGLDAVFVTHLH